MDRYNSVFRHMPIAILTIGLNLLWGCGSDRTDSASQADSAVRVWAVSAPPVVRIAATSEAGRDPFFYAADAVRLSSGVVVVADMHGAAIRYFSPPGDSLLTVGRSGSGPGEFTSPTAIERCGGDTIVAWDRMQGKISVLGPGGELVAEYHPPREIISLSCASSGLMSGVGKPEMVTQGIPDPDAPPLRAPLWIARSWRDSVRVIDSIVPGEQRPLGRLTRVVSSGDSVIVGTEEGGWIDILDLEGNPAGRRSVAVTPRVPTDAQFEHAIDDLVAGLTAPDARRAARDLMLRTYTKPEVLPAYSGLFADRSGRIWVTISAPGDSLTILRGGDGDTLNLEIRMPFAFNPFEVGDGYVLGRRDDEFGRQAVEVYTIEGL